MIKSIELKDFTVFLGKNRFEFSEGINVIVGENGSGKSHLLKLLYAILYSQDEVINKISKSNFEEKLRDSLEENLLAIFRPENIGRLASKKGAGSNESNITMEYFPAKDRDKKKLRFNIKSGAAIQKLILTETPSKYSEYSPIFIPPKEVMSFHSWLPEIYEQKHIAIDRTYVDICEKLGNVLGKGNRAKEVKKFYDKIGALLGGKIVYNQGSNKFYVNYEGNKAKSDSNSMSIEIDLIAEGAKKLAMLYQLLANESLRKNGMLFWDEPEANLNPKWIQTLCQSIIDLSESDNTQIFISTHNLFFVKELLIRNTNNIPIKFFGLKFKDDLNKNEGIDIESNGDFFKLKYIALIEEEIEQMNREHNAKYNKVKGRK